MQAIGWLKKFVGFKSPSKSPKTIAYVKSEVAINDEVMQSLPPAESLSDDILDHDLTVCLTRNEMLEYLKLTYGKCQDRNLIEDRHYKGGDSIKLICDVDGCRFKVTSNFSVKRGCFTITKNSVLKHGSNARGYFVECSGSYSARAQDILNEPVLRQVVGFIPYKAVIKA